MAMRAQIIGIRQAQNTIGDTTCNSTFYSVLVGDENGPTEIVEGELRQISYLIPYMSFAPDGAGLEGLMSGVRQAVHDEVNRVFASLHPLPAVEGLSESLAMEALQAAGFSVRLLNHYPPGIPEGIVHSCTRCDDMLMTAELDIRHPLPSTEGLTTSRAAEILRQAGFQVHMRKVFSTDKPDDTLLKVTRESETSLMVTLEGAVRVPDVTGLTVAEAVERLRGAGFVGVVSSRIYVDQPAEGRVSAWGRAEDGTVSLVVSRGPAILNFTPVKADWNLPQEMEDGLTFGADLRLDRAEKMLYVVLYVHSATGRTPKVKLETGVCRLRFNDRETTGILSDRVTVQDEKVILMGSPMYQFNACLNQADLDKPLSGLTLHFTLLAGITRRKVPWTVNLTF